MLASVCLASGGIYGCIKLEQDSDPSWFLLTDSYLSKFFNAEDQYFPTTGEHTALYIGRPYAPTSFIIII